MCIPARSTRPKISLIAAVSVRVRSVTRSVLHSGLSRFGTDGKYLIVVRIGAKRVGTVIGLVHGSSNACDRKTGVTISSLSRPNSAFGVIDVTITLSGNLYSATSQVSVYRKRCQFCSHIVGSRG